MNRNIRRLIIPFSRSVSALVDLLHCLPPDTIIIDARVDLGSLALFVYLVNPEFSPVDTNAEIPELIALEVSRATFNGFQSFYEGIIDPVTKKEYTPE